MGQEQSLPEDYNTEFDPAAFLEKLKEQAAAEKAGESADDGEQDSN
ncbi:MAG TPA: cell division protein [Corynebacterium sp.]|nr:cell division protein [Corynebacterium sp.]